MQMKTLFLLPILLLSLLSTSCWGVDWDDLKKRDDIYYKKFSDTPFTGKVSGKGQGKMKDGRKEGAWVQYYSDGQLDQKGSYKNGKREGEWVGYHENGQLMTKGSRENGKMEGEWISYHKNGGLSKVGSYKNGKEEGEWIFFHNNERTFRKGTLKNGMREGKWWDYDYDGTLNSDWTGTYKNGRKVSD
jgi:antitoxin component YwqK of YwqJK toxin-antitoxin module